MATDFKLHFIILSSWDLNTLGLSIHWEVVTIWHMSFFIPPALLALLHFSMIFAYIIPSPKSITFLIQFTDRLPHSHILQDIPLLSTQHCSQA